MNNLFLFPNKYKKLGWILFVPSILIGTFLYFDNFDFDNFLKIKVFTVIDDTIFGKIRHFTIIENGILEEILTILIIVGGILVGCSKLKEEDELITKIRYESLIWATYFNYIIIIISTLIVYGFDYFNVILANIFSLLFFFIIRFHFQIYKLNKTSQDDE